MKKRLLIITLLFTLILTVFAQTAVFAEGDDHGADAHSDSMIVEETEDDYDDLSFKEMIIETVKANIKYVVMVVVPPLFSDNEKTPPYKPNPNRQAHSRFFKALSHIESDKALPVD